jgi:hypothetical protein
MSLLWDRFDLGRRSWLRGRELAIGRLRLHTTNLVSGVMFVLLRVVFITYEGTSALSGLYEENGTVDLTYAAERWLSSFANSVPDALVLAGALATALILTGTVLGRRQRRKLRSSTGTSDSVEEFADEKHPK